MLEVQVRQLQLQLDQKEAAWASSQKQVDTWQQESDNLRAKLSKAEYKHG